MKTKKTHYTGIKFRPEIGPQPKTKYKNIILKTIEAAARETAARETAARKAAAKDILDQSDSQSWVQSNFGQVPPMDQPDFGQVPSMDQSDFGQVPPMGQPDFGQVPSMDQSDSEEQVPPMDQPDFGQVQPMGQPNFGQVPSMDQSDSEEQVPPMDQPDLGQVQPMGQPNFGQVPSMDQSDSEEQVQPESHPGVNGAIGTFEVLSALQGTGTKLPTHIKNLKEKLKGSTILTELSRSTDIDLLAVAMKFLEQYPESAGKIVKRMEKYTVLNTKTRPHESSPSVESLWDGNALVELILQDEKDNYYTFWKEIVADLNAYISDVCNPIKRGILGILYNYIIGNCDTTCDTINYDPLYSYNQQTIGNCGFISHTRLIIELIQLLYTCVTGKILGNIRIPNSSCLKIFTVNNILIMLSLSHDKQHVFLFYIMEDYYYRVSQVVKGITKSQLYIYIYVHFYLFMFIMCYLEDSLLGTSENMKCDFSVLSVCIPGNFKAFSDRGTSYDTINIFNRSIMELFSGINLLAKITSRVRINQQSPLKGIPIETIGFIGNLMNCISTAATLITFRMYDFWNTPCSIDGWDKTQTGITLISSVIFEHSESATRFLEDIQQHMSISQYGRIYAGISIQLNKLAEHIEKGTARHLTQEIIDIMFKSIASPSIAKSPHASHAMFILFYRDEHRINIFLRNSWNDCSTSIPITREFLEWAIQEKIIFEVYYFTLHCKDIKLMGGKKTKKIRHNKKRSNRRIKKRSNRRIKKRSNKKNR
jgi:hypothetical protein